MQDIKLEHQSMARLWIGLFGSPVVWMAHFMLIWAIVEGGCLTGVSDRSVLGISVVQFFVIVTSLLGLALVAGVGWIGYRNWQHNRAVDASGDGRIARAVERTHFMAVTGMIFSVLFFTMILLSTLPVFVLPVCDV